MKKLILLLIIAVFVLQASSVMALPGAEKKDCKKWDASTIAINTDWLSADCEAGNFTESVRMTIQVSCPTASVVEIDITAIRSDTSAALEKSLKINSGTALVAGAVYDFSFLVPAGGNWNIQHLTTTQNCSLLTFESLDLNQ